MSTLQQRLDDLLLTTVPVFIDDSFKAIVCGDKHRGNGSGIDDFKKNESLYLSTIQRYYHQGYTLIEGGDDSDLWKFSSLVDIVKAYPIIENLHDVFKKENRYYKIIGNHDRVLSWPEAIVLVHQPSGRRIIIVHLFQGDFINDEGWEFARFLVRNLWGPIESTGLKDPTTPDISTITAQPSNPTKHLQVIKDAKAWAKSHPDIDLIGGHIHFAENDGNCWNWGCWCGPNEVGGQAVTIEGSKIELKFFSEGR